MTRRTVRAVFAHYDRLMRQMGPQAVMVRKHRIALGPQCGCHPRPAIEWRFEILLINPAHQLQIERIKRC